MINEVSLILSIVLYQKLETFDNHGDNDNESPNLTAKGSFFKEIIRVNS